jgi:hypothetical protein
VFETNKETNEMTTEKGEPYYTVSELIELLQRNAKLDDVVMIHVDSETRFTGSIVRENNQRLGRHTAILS